MNVSLTVVTVVSRKKSAKFNAMKTLWKRVTICNLVLEQKEYPHLGSRL